ncbi:MAG: DNA-binding protein [Bacillales bacterium]|jgi:excisionase family DNA binding protein|nr:DNA-binding protein [Bacillales bacterium]
MRVNLELPSDSFVVKRDDLKLVIKDILYEINLENNIAEILTIKEVANFLKVSVPTVRSLIEKGDIPYFQRGQVIRLNKSNVIKWMQQNGQ